MPKIEEILVILKGLHEEAYGGHLAQELTTVKTFVLAGYVWPSLHIDV